MAYWDEEYEMDIARKRKKKTLTKKEEEAYKQRQEQIRASEAQEAQQVQEELRKGALAREKEDAILRNRPRTRSGREPGPFHRTFKHSFPGVGRVKTFFRGKGSAQGGRHRKSRRKPRRKPRRKSRRKLRRKSRRK